MSKINVNLKFKPSAVEGKEGMLQYQLIVDRSVHLYSSNLTIYPHEWDEQEEKIKVAGEREDYLFRTNRRAKWAMKELRRLATIEIMDYTEVDWEEFRDKVRKAITNQSFITFMLRDIDELKAKGNRAYEKRTSTLSAFQKYLNGEDVMFHEMETFLIRGFQDYLKGKCLTMNTISFYMRQLRTVYNKAVKQGKTPQNNPFEGVYTQNDITKKRSITKDDVSRIKTFQTNKPHLAFARDMFMMCFYLRGISFIDLAHLKKTDIAEGYITYHRHKTGQKITIKWLPVMQEIVDRHYPEGEYLLPILDGVSDTRLQCRSKMMWVNRGLHKIAKELNIPITLTTYVSRHSWASIAKQAGVPISDISESLGHCDERTTRIYLATLDNKSVDNANDKVLSMII